MPTLKTILALGVLASGCLRAEVVVPQPDGDTGVTFLQGTQELLRAATVAEKFEIYEGLPHPFEGRKIIEDEIKAKPTVRFDENWFYFPPQPATADEKMSLTKLFDGSAFKPWRGFKLCGGFHGDYAVAFASGGENWLVLFCFGCGEARILRLPVPVEGKPSPAGSRLTVDLSGDKIQQLIALFRSHRKERPPSQLGKPRITPPVPPPVPARSSRGS